MRSLIVALRGETSIQHALHLIGVSHCSKTDDLRHRLGYFTTNMPQLRLKNSARIFHDTNIQMAPSKETIQALLKDYEFKPHLLQRISPRPSKPPVKIIPPNPLWHQIYTDVRTRIKTHLGTLVLDIQHIGSTSIPIPAKDVIDIDLTVPNPTDEGAYVPLLEAAGFVFLTKEPHWHEHRFFSTREGGVNLHVWGPGSPEVERHRIFKEWLMGHENDRALYVSVKGEAARETRERGEATMDYNRRKEGVIREILGRAFRELGYIQ